MLFRSIRSHESPQQWANRVRGPLQELLSKREYSLYHVYCLFASFGQLKSKMLMESYLKITSDIVDLVSIKVRWLSVLNAGNW